MLTTRLNLHYLIGVSPNRISNNFLDRCEYNIDSNFKKNLTEVIIEHIKPISKEIDKLMSDKAYLNKIISSGAEKASEKANVTIKEVYDIVGFVRNET